MEMASDGVLLSILGGKMQLRPLPMRFSTVPYLLNFFIIALTVLSGIIQSFANFLVAITTFMKVYDHLPLLNCLSVLPHFYTLVKQESLNIVP